MKFNFRKHKINLLVSIAASMLSSHSFAQDSLKQTNHSATLKTQFSQIKDAFNYGLVFTGLNVVGEYSLEKTTEKVTIIYNPEFSFGANFNKGVGVACGINPIDFFIGRNINKSKLKPFLLGAYFLTDYNWQLYPYLQGGQMFWFTSIEAGPQIIFAIPIKQQKVKIRFSNSLAGLTSRPKPATEQYFYSLKFSDFITNANSNFEMGYYNLFNHTKLEFELLCNPNKKLSLAYEFEYFGYYKAPRLIYISHSLNLKWKLGKL